MSAYRLSPAVGGGRDVVTTGAVPTWLGTVSQETTGRVVVAHSSLLGTAKGRDACGRTFSSLDAAAVALVSAWREVWGDLPDGCRGSAPCVCGPSHDCRATGCDDDCEACNA